MEDDLLQRFEAACQKVKLTADLDADSTLLFYGLFKQAMNGPPTDPPPSGLIAGQKFAAWKRHEGKSKQQAMEEYVQLAATLAQEAKLSSYGNTVSRFTMESTSLNPAAVSSQEIDSLCVQIRSGKLDPDLLRRLTPNVQDSEGLTPLHHAADAGQAEIVRDIVATEGVDVNIQDLAGMTPLHYAVVLESVEVVQELLKSSSLDLSITDADGQTAADMANDEIREMIKRRLNPE